MNKDEFNFKLGTLAVRFLEEKKLNALTNEDIFQITEELFIDNYEDSPMVSFESLRMIINLMMIKIKEDHCE